MKNKEVKEYKNILENITREKYRRLLEYLARENVKIIEFDLKETKKDNQ